MPKMGTPVRGRDRRSGLVVRGNSDSRINTPTAAVSQPFMVGYVSRRYKRRRGGPPSLPRLGASTWRASRER
jgi:hypothetical protein